MKIDLELNYPQLFLNLEKLVYCPYLYQWQNELNKFSKWTLQGGGV
jgi:hypothetical protein